MESTFHHHHFQSQFIVIIALSISTSVNPSTNKTKAKIYHEMTFSFRDTVFLPDKMTAGVTVFAKYLDE